MTAANIVLFSICGPLVLGMCAWVGHAMVESTEDKLWPRGLRWFPGAVLDAGEALNKLMLRIFWPERRYAFKGREVLRLEALDRDWRTWAGSSEGGVPVWDSGMFRGRGAWRPRTALRNLCPCGYADECSIHCGSGHVNGACPVHDVLEIPKPGVRYER